MDSHSCPSSPPASGINPPPGSGDPPRPSFETIYRSSVLYVRALLRRMGIPQRDLDDLVHDVFLVVHRRHATYDPKASLKAWLASIAWRTAQRHRQLHRNARELLMPDDSGIPEVVDLGLDGEQQAAQAEAVRRGEDLLGEIEIHWRIVFVLHDLEGLEMADIAEVLQIPENTGYTWLRRGRAELKAAIRRQNARDRHKFGGFAAWIPFLTAEDVLGLAAGDGGLVVPDVDAAASWTRFQASLGAANEGGVSNVEVVAEAVFPGQGAAEAGWAKLAAKAKAVAWVKGAAAGAALFLAGAATGAGVADWAAHSRHPLPPVEKARDEIAALTAVSPVTAPIAEVPTPSASAGPVPIAVSDAAQADTDAGLLLRARTALRAGKATRARELLRRHAAKHPRSPNAQQRDALLIEALARIGQRAEAAALAERFLAAFPDTLHRSSIEAALRGP